MRWACARPLSTCLISRRWKAKWTVGRQTAPLADHATLHFRLCKHTFAPHVAPCDDGKMQVELIGPVDAPGGPLPDTYDLLIYGKNGYSLPDELPLS